MTIQQLRSLAALPEHRSSVPCTHLVTQSISSGLYRNCMYTAYRLTCRQNTHIHKIITRIVKRKHSSELTISQ